MNMDLNKLNLKEASEKLKNEKITSTEIIDDCLTQIGKKDNDINAYLTVLSDEAKKSAEESDMRRKSGRVASEIDGLPIAIKDVICTKSIKTTAGSKILENFIPPYDATVVSKLKDAGAIIIGKTNLDEFAMGSSTENSAFKITKNPWDISRVPGGSSGGSAAAVASEMCLAALGSDTGGSIRFPASLCGVVGLKPTYGAVSRYGLMAMASSLDQIGTFTKTVEDAEILFNIISGFDKQDSTSLNKELNKSKDPKNMVLGIPKEYFSEGLDPKVKEVIEKAIEKLKPKVKEVVEISLPNAQYALEVYYIIMFVEVSSNLARYDGVKYGYSTKEAKDLIEVYFKSRAEAFGAEAKRRIILGNYASSAGYIDQYYSRAQKVRTLVKKDFEDAFKKVDLILGPVSPTTAFKIGEKTDDPLTMYLSDIYTISINLAGIPAMSVPAGLSNNLPVGLQIIGPGLSENNIFSLGKTFEGARGELPSAPV
ncbi:MAG: gatA [Candidatus Berkelbacteria bacterium]|nr:gatA [Candidatus Berkelbacteria bacterium]